ncbi:ubiquitin ligase complex component [Candida orthopsilosis Co 90-125]|uniref:Ubiquitin ligase complex component n=1 Tax=Candida orthopsilosis (strain 90-125) TaxID=1136231 RepID=H8X272_CANO9|nr:ubiquitin ligase complex component [Candida orthopsilosis Co 90-125]CCG22794.1 ubiquitin ligase complex component [Candida orthopsilosis Co 90-125]
MNLQNNCASDEQVSPHATTSNFNHIINSTVSSNEDTASRSGSRHATPALSRQGSPSILPPHSSIKSTIVTDSAPNDLKAQALVPPSPPSNSSSNSPVAVPNQDVSVVTPFLVKHISDQSLIPKDNFHKYCYRHNPDITCNKQTDEVKMKKLQEKLEDLPNRDQEAISHVWSIFSAAPEHHRKLILQGILTQCCFPQLSFVSQEVASLIKIDFISTLPQEIALKILCYLDCNSLCNAAQVSRKWKTLADDDRVWHHMCEQHIDRKCPNCGWGLPLMHMKRARDMTEEEIKPIKRNEDAAREAGDASQQGPISAQRYSDEPDRKKLKVDPKPTTSPVLKKRPWKSVYSERFKLEKNWRKGVYKMKSFIGHKDGITCLQFNRKYLMTGSYDSTIKIWKIETGECVKTLTGHTKGVRSLVFDNQKLITGGLDSTIKVWNYHTGQCIATYRGHDDAVVSVDFSNKSIVSGSADSTVRVWHVDSRTCYTLRGHTDWVNCVKIHPGSNTIFSASDDTTIRMWDMNTNQCLKIFGGMENNGHIGQVQCVIPLTYKDELIEDASEGESEHEQSGKERQQQQQQPGSLSLPTQSAPQHTTTNTSSSVRNLVPATNSFPTHILTSSLDNTIKLWDVSTGKCIRTQFGHIEGVWSIAADTFRIISGAHDRMIKVWDLQNGKCLHTFGNAASVSCVALSDSKFVSGLENGEVKMYCFD